MLSYRFRFYPSKAVQAKLQADLEFCRWLCNCLLEEMTMARSEGRKMTKTKTQALIVKLKEEKPELKNSYSKVLQMVNYQVASRLQ